MANGDMHDMDLTSDIHNETFQGQEQDHDHDHGQGRELSTYDPDFLDELIPIVNDVHPSPAQIRQQTVMIRPGTNKNEAAPASLPCLQNIVGTCNYDTQLPVKLIAKKFAGQHNSFRFAAAIIRLIEPKITILVFETGRAVITGCKSEYDVALGFHKFKCMVLEQPEFHSLNMTVLDIQIQNMVASCNLGYAVDLLKLQYTTNNTMCDYEPELFPGLHFWLDDPDVMYKMFTSGSVIVTGARCREMLKRAFMHIYTETPKYRLEHSVSFKDILVMKQNANYVNTLYRDVSESLFHSNDAEYQYNEDADDKEEEELVVDNNNVVNSHINMKQELQPQPQPQQQQQPTEPTSVHSVVPAVQVDTEPYNAAIKRRGKTGVTMNSRGEELDQDVMKMLASFLQSASTHKTKSKTKPTTSRKSMYE